MSFNRRESAEWALAVDAEAEKLLTGVDKALADGAARGFPAPPGDTLATLLALGQDTKGKLAGEDGKIYDTRRGVIFQQDEYALSILVKLARLAMELYREQIFNALSIEEAQEHATATRALADVERHNSETELRQKAIIMHRAEAERRIIVYKAQLVEAEKTTLIAEQALITAQIATTDRKLELVNAIFKDIETERITLASEQALITAQLATGEKRLEVISKIYPLIEAERITLAEERMLITAQMATSQEKLELINAIYRVLAAERATLLPERLLIQAQIATATKKLEIIASIYQVLAAEQLVVAAEQRRAAALQNVLVAELIVAGIKKDMVPYYIEKATALEDYAQAIIDDLPIEEALIRLGYDRIDLKTTDEYAGHLEREQQEELELLKEQFTRASTVLEYARADSRRLLLEYRNAVQKQIMDKKMSLEEDGISFKLTTSLERMGIGVNNDVALAGNEVTNLTTEMQSIMKNLAARGSSSAEVATASANTNAQTFLYKTYQHFIRSGFGSPVM